MTKISKYKKDNFTVMSNRVVLDERLSWKARGVFSYLYAQSNEWQFYENEVSRHAPDGRTSLRTALKELEDLGYLKRQKVKNAKGHFGKFDWVINDEPMLDVQMPNPDKPCLENPTSENPTSENRTLTNTNLTNTKLNKLGGAECIYTIEQICDKYVEKIGLVPDKHLFSKLMSEGYTDSEIVDVINMASTWSKPENLTPSRLYNRTDHYLKSAHEMGYVGGKTPNERRRQTNEFTLPTINALGDV